MSQRPRVKGWCKRLPILAALSLLFTLPVGFAAQLPAEASVTVTTFAGTGTAGFSGDGGAATSAQLNQPQGLVTDGVGNVFIWDNLNRRIREVSATGTISTYSGNGSWCNSSGLTNYWGSDSSGLCSSSYPVGFGGGPGGILWINNGGWLDEVYPGSKQHAAGSVTGNYSPGDGTDYGVSVAPNSLALGSQGVFFAEAGASGWPGNSIKLWSLGYGVSTIAGMSGTSTCNYYPNVNNAPLPAVGTCIHPQYLTLWSHYLYFFDASPGWQGPTIWRIDLSPGTWTLSRVAGSGSWSDYGSNGSTAINDGISSVGPIAVDSNGNLFFGSTSSGSIREVDTSGKMWNVTDIGAAQSSYAIDGANNLYVSEASNNKVVKVTGLDPVTNKGNLVAIGDSVPAGEGINYGFAWNGFGWVRTGPSNPAWADTTSALGANYQDCHQSGYSYVNYFSAQYTVYDMACTGATALQEPGVPGGDNVTTAGGVMVHEQFGDGTTMPAELGTGFAPVCSGCDTVNPPTLFDTQLGSSGTVLLQLGADDIDFGDWIKRCYMGVTTCQSSDQSILDLMLSQEKTDLRTIITEISNRAALDGYSSSHKLHLVVTDYYNPYGSSYNGSCIDTGNSFYQGVVGITSDQQTFIVKGLKSLDGNIKAEVDYANANDSNLNVTLVDLSGLYGGADIMSGHGFCSADPWVYGPSIDYPDGTHWLGQGYPAPMHPTPEGQQAIYQAVQQQAGL